VSALTWPEVMPQYGPIRLRPFQLGDLDLVAELSSDPYVPLIGTVPAVFTEAEGLAYLRRQHSRLTDGSGWSFAIAERGTDRAVGNAGLWQHDGRSAAAGYVVAPRYRGRGYAKAALRALTTFAWTQSDIDYVDLFVEPANLASIAVARSCGYREAELLPRHLEIGGHQRDMIRYTVERR
jgi:[ribosomal protein S5]-alanine N-acetyltransferase